MLCFSYHKYLSSRKKERSSVASCSLGCTFIVSTIIVVLFDKEGDLKQ